MLLTFDTETTGVDALNDRIVQLVIVITDDNGNAVQSWEWIIDPGVDVPDEAADVHGFRTEYLRANGMKPEEALRHAFEVFTENFELTWVAYNMSFDLTLLDAEFRRHGIYNTFAQTAEEHCSLFDPLVWDRAKDPFRKGKRKLMNVATHYKLDFNEDELHNAIADVELTGRVALAVLDKYGQPTTSEQKSAYRTWANNLTMWLNKNGNDDVVNPEWPYRIG